MVGIAATTAPAAHPHGTRWSRRPSRRSARALPSRRRNRRRSTRRCTPPPREPTHLAQRGWRRGGPEQRPPLLRAGWAIMTSHRHMRLCTCSARAVGPEVRCKPSWSRLQNSNLGIRGCPVCSLFDMFRLQVHKLQLQTFEEMGGGARGRRVRRDPRTPRSSESMSRAVPVAEEEEEIYSRPLPLTSCQEDRLGLDYTVLCYG